MNAVCIKIKVNSAKEAQQLGCEVEFSRGVYRRGLSA